MGEGDNHNTITQVPKRKFLGMDINGGISIKKDVGKAYGIGFWVGLVVGVALGVLLS